MSRMFKSFVIATGIFFILIAGAAFIFLAKSTSDTVPPLFEPAALSWTSIASSSPWETRDSAAAFVFDGKMWIMGGIDGNNVPVGPDHAVEYWKAPHFNDIWNSEDGVSWHLVATTSAWAPRRSMSVVSFNGALWMFGGWSPEGSYQSDVWQSKDGVRWTRVLTEAPWESREGQWAEVFQGKLWMMGGVNYDVRKTFNDVWFTEDGIVWREASAPWSPRWDHATAVFQNKLWLTGGMDFTSNAFDDEWVTEDGITWTEVHTPWPSRQGHMLIPYQGHLWLMGRLNDDVGGGANDVWYSKDGIAWTKGADPRWSGREDFWALVYRNQLWVFSGMDNTWRWTNDVWVSSPVPPLRAPVLVAQSQPLDLSAASYISVYVDPRGEEQVLVAKNEDTPLLIASITKLMTALVADTDNPHALLIASDNAAAEASAAARGRDNFVRDMNKKAASLGLTSMHFVNPSGVDPAAGSAGNVGSASDLVVLMRYLRDMKPDLFQILGQKEYGLLRNTNELLAGAPLHVLGGKTGETPLSGQNLVIVSESPVDGYLISVVLGSADRATDMWKLLDYVRTSFDW